MATDSSTKKAQINKINNNVVIIAIVAIFVVTFCLISGKSLFGQMLYQNKVVGAKEKALHQLKADVVASSKLVTSYQNFVGTKQNLIGGAVTGNAANDGDNAKIILDALPSQYDYPALVASVQNLITSKGLYINSISGTDQQATISGASTSGSTSQHPVNSAPSSASSLPVNSNSPVAMPFEVSFDGQYQPVENLITDLSQSIRPIDIQTIQLSGNQSNLTVDIVAQTFYQPQKDFKIKTETIKK